MILQKRKAIGNKPKKREFNNKRERQNKLKEFRNKERKNKLKKYDLNKFTIINHQHVNFLMNSM